MIHDILRSFTLVADAHSWFAPTVAFVFGALIGSFLNVVIHRVPAGRSVIFPGSQCACGEPIRWYRNIPIASWFLLRGKAACCGRWIPFRYAFVEILTAVLFAVIASRFPADRCAAIMLLVAILIAATFIDIEHMIIPDSLTIGAGVVGVIVSVMVPSLHGVTGHSYVSMMTALDISIQGMLIGSGLVLWIALLAEVFTKRESIGFGDVKLVGMIGAFCGAKATLFTLFGGAVVGTCFLIVLLAWRGARGHSVTATDGSKLGMGTQIPFGPMLATAAVIYAIWLKPSVDPFMALRGLAPHN